MKDYFYFHKSWKAKLNDATILVALIASNAKRQMTTKEEGLLFIRLMRRTYTQTHTKKRRI